MDIGAMLVDELIGAFLFTVRLFVVLIRFIMEGFSSDKGANL